MKPNVEGLQRTFERWPGVESLLRSCQLILIIWLAFFGAQFAAKGVVQAGTLLVGLFH
jgi:hypothetical protein